MVMSAVLLEPASAAPADVDGSGGGEDGSGRTLESLRVARVAVGLATTDRLGCGGGSMFPGSVVCQIRSRFFVFVFAR